MGRQYLWTVDDQPTKQTLPDQGFVDTTPIIGRKLHIISSNKRFIVHYQLPQPGDSYALLQVEGSEFPRQPGAKEVEVPRWHHDTKPYPTADFVRRLIGWCLGIE
ncbi:MAG: hypothetical protein R3C44_05695 [Chloroflexota bacterium]